MLLEKVNELLDKINGDYSVFYPLLKNRLGKYSARDLAFAGEFMFFEEKYLKVKKHMIENNIEGKIVDIGCQLGFQSEIFLDNDYMGIDRYNYDFFNKEMNNISYMVGKFPEEIDVDLSSKVVISSMSLGYFNNIISDDEDKALDIIEEKLKGCKNLYIATTQELLERLKNHFSIVTPIYSSEVLGNRFDMYYFGN